MLEAKGIVGIAPLGGASLVSRILGAAIMAAALAACGRGEEAERVKSGPFTMSDGAAHAEIADFGPTAQLTVKPYGKAALSLADGGLRLEQKGAGEVGFALSIDEGETPAGPLAVKFRLNTPENWTIRLPTADGYEYASTSDQRTMVLDPTRGGEGLLFAKNPGPHALAIDGIYKCSDPAVQCGADGSVKFGFRAGRSETLLFRSAFGRALIEADAADEFRVGLRPGATTIGIRIAPDSSAATPTVVFFDPVEDRAVSLRVRDGDKFAYQAATTGEVVIPPGGAALFYREGGVAFDLKVTDAFECGDRDDWRCKKADDLLALLPAPNGGDEFDRLIALLEWAAKNADYAGSANIFRQFEFAGLSASQIYFRYFEKDVAAGYCGGGAVFFTKLLQDEGFDAFTFNFGVLKDGLTHVTTIVRVGDGFYLFDPTFGAYLADPENGRPIDLFKALGAAPHEFVSLDMTGRDFLYGRTNNPALGRQKRKGVIRNCRVSDGSRSTVRCDRPAFDMAEYLQNWRLRLMANNVPVGDDTLLALMRRGYFNAGTSDNAATLDRFTDELAAHSIPFIPTAEIAEPSL